MTEISTENRVSPPVHPLYTPRADRGAPWRRVGAVLLALVWGQGAAAQDLGAEMVEALETRCLPLIAEGVLETATLSEVPSFIASNFFELLGVEGDMYQLSPAGDARIVIPEDRATCVAYVQAQEPDEVLAAIEAWRTGAGFEGALPDRAAGETEGLLASDAAQIAVRIDEDRLYLILTVTAGG